MLIRNGKTNFGLKLFLLLVLVAGSLQAQVEPDRSGLGKAEFKLTELEINSDYRLPANLPDEAAPDAVTDLGVLGLTANSGMIDVRSGRWATLMLSEPLLPGQGKGNNLKWANLGQSKPKDDVALSHAASQAFHAFLQAASQELRIDTTELVNPGKVTVHGNGDSIQIYVPRVHNGVKVRGNSLTATISQGNLTLFGAVKWGDINTSTSPSITENAALNKVQSHVGSYPIKGSWSRSELELIPLARGENPKLVTVGQGYDYRLAWVLRPAFDGELRHFEALVDAHSGELLSFEDTNQYADVVGGVYPVTNDGIIPDGVEQPGWPMPYQDISTTSGTLTTDTGGNVAAVGTMTATLSGPYVNINDNCGTHSLTQSDGIDWGDSGGTDCVTPGFGGAGNTHASRTGFYELNKIIEMGRGQLPSNTWLQQQLTSNMNINQTCNAFWGGGTVNFYRSGGGCFNTGEIAGVFDHEWGHGLDDNDAFPTIASPSGEGIADIYTALRLNDSCIGRNFRSTNCTGFGDPCLDCTGVRDIDYEKRQSGIPHDYTWSNANCGGSVHCVGSVYAEAVWSLWKRHLQSPPYNYDDNTAHEIVNRLTFVGGGFVNTWFSGGPPNGGCDGGSGYMNFLVADDDNGNLGDGTPHMAAIYAAFNEQQIACGTPVVQDSGCAGTPTTAPVVTTGNGNQLITLSWGAVAGATEYEVFRTEGVFACDFGKVKIASTTGTSWNDTGIQNGRDYSYVVIPKGPSDSCFGPASACATDAGVGQPDFSVSCAPSSLAIAQGGSDTATCTVISSYGYTGNVDLSCLGNPADVSCSFAPVTVSPPADGSDASTLTLNVDLAQTTGTFVFDVVADDTSEVRTAQVTVQVIPEGSNGPQDAIYDGALGAPKCAVAGGVCNSQELLEGRGPLGPEPNQPNTLDVCADGITGSYLSDESNERIVVSTLDGGNFTEGDTVEIATTVHAWSTGSTDTLDLYYAADANNPVWTLIASIVPPAGGLQTLTAQYVLPTGAMQAVRASFRYQGAEGSCSTGTYDDRDDLVFTVETLGGECIVDADCDNGLFCDGTEVCNAGICDAGTSPICDDGTFCNGAETCNEATDSCDAGTPPACDNGLFCDGTESCNEGTDSCDAGTPPVCDDGAFCNGVETCDEANDVCGAGTAPDSDDGVACTDDSCDEVNDVVVNAPNDGLCDNGAFCDGVETCDAINDCQPGSDPCSGNECNEVTDMCVAPPAGDVHVEAVLTTNQGIGKGNKVGVAQVTIYDENETVAGAGYTVTGNFSGTFDEVGVTAVTNANGVAELSTAGSAKKGVVVNFCVSDVTGTLAFDPSDHNSASFACGAPPPVPVCGNGIIEIGEMCDGTNLGGETCTDQGYTGGELACQTNCLAFDVSACTGNVCVPTHSKEKGPRCSDGLDNDCDLLTDGDDPDC